MRLELRSVELHFESREEKISLEETWVDLTEMEATLAKVAETTFAPGTIRGVQLEVGDAEIVFDGKTSPLEIEESELVLSDVDIPVKAGCLSSIRVTLDLDASLDAECEDEVAPEFETVCEFYAETESDDDRDGEDDSDEDDSDEDDSDEDDSDDDDSDDDDSDDDDSDEDDSDDDDSDDDDGDSDDDDSNDPGASDDDDSDDDDSDDPGASDGDENIDDLEDELGPKWSFDPVVTLHGVTEVCDPDAPLSESGIPLASFDDQLAWETDGSADLEPPAEAVRDIADRPAPEPDRTQLDRQRAFLADWEVRARELREAGASQLEIEAARAKLKTEYFYGNLPIQEPQ